MVFERLRACRAALLSLGRTVEPTDAATIDQLVEAAKSGGHSLRTLVTAIVRTEAFRTK